jgi:hypothetical protein
LSRVYLIAWLRVPACSRSAALWRHRSNALSAFLLIDDRAHVTRLGGATLAPHREGRACNEDGASNVPWPQAAVSPKGLLLGPPVTSLSANVCLWLDACLLGMARAPHKCAPPEQRRLIQWPGLPSEAFTRGLTGRASSELPGQQPYSPGAAISMYACSATVATPCVGGIDAAALR